MPPGFDRLESFGHDELTAKHCYFRCSRPPDVDGIKSFDKDADCDCGRYFNVFIMFLNVSMTYPIVLISIIGLCSHHVGYIVP